jgi:TorA maturation chaperone TorD/Pyruvate/2-oxoacid:ferredoxin oxidoreductase delta subunit
MIGTLRSELYGAFAEVFSDPPDWLALSGSEWPLYSIATDLAISSINGQQAIERMQGISPEPIAIRQERYNALFSGPGRPRFWLYESLYRSGKLFGSETMDVEGIYRTAGLVIEGAELPDHVSLELAFLAYVANQQVVSDPQTGTWVEIERNFIKAHAGLWLPALGRDLAASGDEVYAPIGQLLADWLMGSRQPLHHGYSPPTGLCTPVLQKVENCNLCGFCVQVCPRRVLRIHEDSGETVLLRSGRSCNGCGKCVRICPVRVLMLGKLITGAGISGEMVVLRSSPRAHCPKCGRPTVSQAELECIVGQIGRLPWLELCQECRFISMEDVR